MRTNKLRVLVTGGRDFADRALLEEVLTEVRPDRLAHGKAAGADTMAREWAFAHRPKCLVHGYAADWATHGKAAGPIRNQEMLDDFQPDIVIAFPGNNGTADMCERAEKAGVPLVRIQPSEDWREKLLLVLTSVREKVSAEVA